MTITVPDGAGGIVDNTARAYAERLGQELGQPVVVENKGGTGGMIDMAAVAKGPAERSLALVNASGPVNGLIDESKLKLLAVGAPTRLAARPGTPTLAELGYPAANMSSTFGFFAPGSASPAHIARMNALINKISAMPEISKPLTDALNVMQIGSAETFAAQVRKEYEASGRIVKDADIRVD